MPTKEEYDKDEHKHGEVEVCVGRQSVKEARLEQGAPSAKKSLTSKTTSKT